VFFVVLSISDFRIKWVVSRLHNLTKKPFACRLIIMGQIRAHDISIIRNVWATNFEKEFESLLSIVRGSPAGTIMGFDVEFPGFLREEAYWCSSHEIHYQALRANVDLLKPIQIGFAVAGMDGRISNAWNFNLKFDADIDLHTESALAMLKNAGLNFAHHARFGIDASLFGLSLAGSPLVGRHGQAPCWITLSGQYDFGYLAKLLTAQQLPSDNDAFQQHLNVLCPRRCELRDQCPYGSLDTLAFQHGIVRRGSAHTAGSDALTTLELYLALVHPPSFSSIPRPPGLSIATPPGLSLPCPPGPAATTQYFGGGCTHGDDSFGACDRALAVAFGPGLWPEDWRSSSCCEAAGLALPFGDASGDCWRHHARRAMATGTARDSLSSVSCCMIRKLRRRSRSTQIQQYTLDGPQTR
jgi:CCR4-NOT transcription complex subunit 7/8